jgi:hypothetical protein
LDVEYRVLQAEQLEGFGRHLERVGSGEMVGEVKREGGGVGGRVGGRVGGVSKE